MDRRFFAVLAVPLAFLLVRFATRPGWTFTQSGLGTAFGNAIPMGHEWVTRMAAIELLGYSPRTVPDIPDPNDPRKTWRQGLAKNTDLSAAGAQAEVRRIKGQPWNDERYLSRYKAVYDAIVGERWVDLAGYNAATSRTCWDSVAQEPASIQYDHFMRRYNEIGGEGGEAAAAQSQFRFMKYFVAAAMAAPGIMNVYDGGFSGSTAVDVDRNYFLFGRAVHLFEDSFSTEHTVRVPADNYVRVHQVKSYLCAPGSEQHTHSIGAVLNYSSGDVIWKQGTQLDPSWNSYKASNMKDPALVATEATKDLWAAFIRTMATPLSQRRTYAEREARTLAINWLNFELTDLVGWYDDVAHRDSTYVLMPDDRSGKGQTQSACMAGLNVGTTDQQAYVRQLDADQKKCLYNAIPWVGYSDLFDPDLHMWFSWRWRNGPTGALLDPPNNWQIPNPAADSGVRVRIKSAANQQYMSAPDGIANNAWVYCKSGAPPLDFILVGSKEDGRLRVANAPLLFLSYTSTTGAVKLWSQEWSAQDPASYKFSKTAKGWSIMNTYWKQYVWLYDKYQSPYLSREGNPSNLNAQWIIEGLQ